MILPQKKNSEPNLDITPLIDVVFLLLVFMLLTMTFTQNNKSDTEEAIIDIQLAKSSTATKPNPSEAITLLIDENGNIFPSDSVLPVTKEEVRLFLSKKRLSAPDLFINIKADHRVQHGQVIDVLDMIKEIGINQVNLVIEKSAQ